MFARTSNTLHTALLTALLPMAAAAQDNVLELAPPQQAGVSDAVVQSAVSLYRAAVARRTIAGAVLLIARNGKVVVHEAFGWRDIGRRVPMEPSALFRMSSNTKPVTAAAVALLADRRSIRFADSVKTHIKSWSNRKARTITIHQLLSHTSGIEIDALFPRRLVRWPWAEPATLQSETIRIGNVGAKALPGTSYFYSNAGYNALAGLVEVVSGQPLDVFLREHIFGPLDMRDTYGVESVEYLRHAISRLGPTYERTAGGFRARWRPGEPPETPFPRGSGGLVTTAWDYAVFMQMLLNGGTYGNVRLLLPQTVRTMLTAHTPPGSRGYGYGWGINPDCVFTHSGSTGTFAWGDPTRGIIVIAFAQTYGATDLRPQLMEIIEGGVRVPRGERRPTCKAAR